MTTIVFPVITEQHSYLFSNMDGKTVTLPVLQSYMKTCKNLTIFTKTTKHNYLISPANRSQFRQRLW
jgi:hypothetical protein